MVLVFILVFPHQINITVHEGQQLAGLNIDPVVKVQVGEDTKYTSIKQSTNCPYFSEVSIISGSVTLVEDCYFDEVKTSVIRSLSLEVGDRRFENLLAKGSGGPFPEI